MPKKLGIGSGLYGKSVLYLGFTLLISDPGLFHVLDKNLGFSKGYLRSLQDPSPTVIKIQDLMILIIFLNYVHGARDKERIVFHQLNSSFFKALLF